MTQCLIHRLWAAIGIAGAAAMMSEASAAEWSLVWSDEFAQPDGSAPDSARWVYDIGANKWGNEELETYTDRRQNSRIEDGKLIIEALKESFSGSNGIVSTYTSARLKTQGKAAWTFGRMEARIKLPRGQGIWPAFWMLGTNITKVGWPDCGEIDIMENIGREPFTIHGTIHGPGYSGGDGVGGAITNRVAVADDFHLFAVEWDPARIRWFFDDKLYFTVTPTNLPVGTKWVFNQSQFLILNVAVGGSWPGNPDATTSFPQRMEVDCVRVYARTNTPRTSVPAPTSNRTFAVNRNGSGASSRMKGIHQPMKVGPLQNGETALATSQLIRAAGDSLTFGGRPVDLALSPNGRTVYIKNMNSLLVVDVARWSLLQELNFPGSGASMHGIAVSGDGSHVYVTGAEYELYEAAVAASGNVSWSRTISMPGNSDPCGIALSPDGTKAFVCLSRSNTLAVVNLQTGALIRQIDVGVAPFDVVLSTNGNTAYVSDWGGRRSIAGDVTADSAGTQVVVDSRGIGASGVVSFVDLIANTQTSTVTTGLHPSDVELSRDGLTLYVANANSDIVTAINTRTATVRESILVRPDPTLPFGSAPNALALSRNGSKLFVANAGNNAIAVVELPHRKYANSRVTGFIPTDWFPGGLVASGNHLFVANVKGLGSRNAPANTNAWEITQHLGSANKIPIPSNKTLRKYTAEVHKDSRVAQMLGAMAAAQSGQPPVPVPRRTGEPSVFQHVVYVVKENKTYDQVFGDLPQGNGEQDLCVFGRLVAPNHHALAEQYVLLDNFYCNGVLSADGHSWVTEANSTDHLEKSFGGFVRSYTFGDDPLTYSSSGFIWNNVLMHGLSFRNYGEFDYASPVPGNASWLTIYQDFTNHTGLIKYSQNIGVAPLRPYSSTNCPGWNLGIPDVVRAAGFIKELKDAETNGFWPAFQLLYLPNDHTSGVSPGFPTPRAQVADNDLALGQVVETITRSSFASNTCIFVIEDDPQSGYDHVDGHRSICLVISPYTKRGVVLSQFYNQTAVIHTMERILGIPPMNQMDGLAPLMTDCFTDLPNFQPYTALTNKISLAEMNPDTASLSRKERYWANKSMKLNFSQPDRADEDTLNKIVWHSIKGVDARYPALFAGAHGKGLKKLNLMLTGEKDDD